MSDTDLFSDRVQHLYFYGDVDDGSVAKLQSDIQVANQSTQKGDIALAPKPIVIHVHSPGGSVYAAMSMLTVFTRSHVPICVMVDGQSASAATMLSVMAPYRVAATPHVLTLIHQYHTWKFGTREEVEFFDGVLNEAFDETFRSLYLANTRLTSEQLDGLLCSDVLLDAAFCLEHGILDRVLDIGTLTNPIDTSKTITHMPLEVLMNKTNWNTFTIACPSGGGVTPETSAKLDGYLCQNSDSLKPVLYYCTSRCSLEGFDWVPVAARLRAFRAPVYSVVDSVVSIWDYLPALFCARRYMFAHAILYVDVVYLTSWGRRLPDIVHNTGVIVGGLRDVLRERTRLPVAVLDALSLRRFKFNAQECLAYGLCDEIVPLGGRRG